MWTLPFSHENKLNIQTARNKEIWDPFRQLMERRRENVIDDNNTIVIDYLLT